MSFETSFVTWLKANVPLVTNRIYAVSAPQDITQPYLVYTLISAPRAYSHSGVSGIVEARYQINICADSYATTKSIAKQLRDALSGYRGAIGTETVYSAFCDTELDSHDDNSELYVSISDYMISYKE